MAEEPDDFRQKRVVYVLPGMEQAVIRKNIPYKFVGELPLLLDVYYPADFNGETLLPAVLFAHGDAPTEILKDAKDWGAYISWGQLVAASGLIAVTANRRSTEGLTMLHESASDLDDLLKFVYEQGKSLGIDTEAIGLWTCSGGAYLGLRSAFCSTQPVMRCVISYYGVSDLNVYFGESQEETEEPEETVEANEAEHTLPVLAEEVMEEFSAAHTIQQISNPASIPPMLIVRAGLDHPDLNASIDRLVMAALAKNVDIGLLNHATGHHAFDCFDDNSRSREIIRATLDFLKGQVVSRSHVS